MDIREFLKANQMRLSTFAQQAGLKQSYASLIKNGRRRPSPNLALRIQEATDGAVTVMELLFPKNTNGGR
jgi:transcriptional regulator with XRE-family HTH domain